MRLCWNGDARPLFSVALMVDASVAAASACRRSAICAQRMGATQHKVMHIAVATEARARGVEIELGSLHGRSPDTTVHDMGFATSWSVIRAASRTLSG